MELDGVKIFCANELILLSQVPGVFSLTAITDEIINFLR